MTYADILALFVRRCSLPSKPPGRPAPPCPLPCQPFLTWSRRQIARYTHAHIHTHTRTHTQDMQREAPYLHAHTLSLSVTHTDRQTHTNIYRQIRRSGDQETPNKIKKMRCFNVSILNSPSYPAPRHPPYRNWRYLK